MTHESKDETEDDIKEIEFGSIPKTGPIANIFGRSIRKIEINLIDSSMR